jgi:signal transduction histidine kinase
VAVRNEGRGFTPADRDRLFRKFSRLDDPELQKQKGTGVGLYTVWRVVNLHGGRVDAASEPGQWAEFSFRIPQDQK